MSKKPVRKAVFPVAGLGTRVLPATKTVPKEMLTVVDRPVLQHCVEEAREAGIEHFIFVTGRNKAVIEDHFDVAYELEETLRRRGKMKELEDLRAALPAAGATSFTRQQEPLGLGHAIWCAREVIDDEPFAVLLPDMITLPGADGKRCLQQCMDTYAQFGANVIAVEQVPMDETHKYGVVAKGKDYGPSFEIDSMVEKPPKGTSPSNYIISGRYILQPEIFDLLGQGQKGAGGEIQLTDSMLELAKMQKFFARDFDGKTYDTGSKIGFLAANVAFALARPDIEPGFRAELKRIVGSL
ncbi:UTP--glucose-1-phosphate uridylyltransferase [Rhodoblastus acidophilus]|uniref:UTP--glucose-1-phosphate uridylyltransferase n=1 Tax=Candidatus Rhodoblastus alkanivorans TaxID=2954117 RepID=A0ABS9ZAV5_9HYPH|nr:UTP--glucose-1-phosphate uridylyltransferase [Candidatus Rhodoblastus alkanivorans]MCI4679359.1 UTP--glucose-1-phosphate uridylyltransferase [Candidatus Rhodoblastus alkanivorans]MCI4684835.1 UTP--glucose-1-phosphate uridylyltransferase [Candidatus Rhodoblastus alkanivorans]MDI4642159.1 UTP--glucose-1-phosphate uridylyltransferase [Rhodoblastus acidophilus]